MDKNRLLSLSEQNKFLESEAYALYNLLSRTKSILSMCTANYFEFRKLAHIQNDTPFEKFWTKHKSKARQNHLRKLNTRLSNYLSSISSAIDYSRSHLIPILNTDDNVFYIYNKYLQEFLFDKSHYFIIGLRNYALHNLPLNVFSEYSLNIEWDSPRQDFYLSKKELLIWSGWQGNAKIFLDAVPEKIYLINLFDKHYYAFTDFQKNIKLLTLRVNFEKTIERRFEFKKILDSVNRAQASVLPFYNSYLRYLDLLILKASKLN